MPTPRPITIAMLGLALAIGAACSDDGPEGEDSAGATTTEGADGSTTTSPAQDDDDTDDDGGFGGEPDCLLDDDAVAAVAGEEVVESSPRFGSVGRGSSDFDVSLSDEGCAHELASGRELVVAAVVDTDDSTAVAEFAELVEHFGDEGVIADLGDEAVLLDGRYLYVRVGDDVFVVKDQSDQTDPDPVLLAALAAEVLAVEAG